MKSQRGSSSRGRGGMISLLLSAVLVFGGLPCGAVPQAIAVENDAVEAGVVEDSESSALKGEAAGDKIDAGASGSDEASSGELAPTGGEGSFALTQNEEDSASVVAEGASGESDNLALPAAASASDGAYIGGNLGTDPLKIVYNEERYTVKVQRVNAGGTEYKNQYYSDGVGNSSGVCFSFDMNGATYTYGTEYLSGSATVLNSSTPCAEGGGYSASVENGVISLMWSKVKVGLTDATFDFELRYAYASGSEGLTRSYNITPHGATFTNSKLAYGGDAYFSGSDKGTSWALWDGVVHMVYLKGISGTDTMSLSSNSASGYYAGSYSEGKTWAENFQDTNTATNTTTDNGYYLQWRPGILVDGATSTRTATEGFSGSVESVRIFTPDNNPAKADASVGQIMKFNFVVANLGTTTSTVNSFAASSSSSDVTAEYIGNESYTIESTKNVVVPVRVVVPQGTSAQDVRIGLSASYGAGTPVVASAALSVQNLDITLPTIANVEVDTAAAKIRFDVFDGTEVSSDDPDNVKTVVTSLGNNRYELDAAKDGFYIISAADDSGHAVFVKVEYSQAVSTRTVQYSAPGSTGAVPSGLEHACVGTNVRVADASGLSKSSLSFAGWEYGGKVYQPGDMVTVGAENIAFAARWVAQVTYNYAANGGVSSTAPTAGVTLAEGSSVDLAYTASKGEGYDFIGWNTDKTAAVKLDSLSVTTGDLELFALFQKKAALAPQITSVVGSAGSFGYEPGSLTVKVQASPPVDHVLSYQWYEQKADDGAGIGTAIGGADQASYAIPMGKDAGRYRYFCNVTATRNDNAEAATVSSDAATVQISPASNKLRISCSDATYTGAACLVPAVEENVAQTSVAFWYKKRGDSDDAYSPQAPLAAGDYTVKAVSAASANYYETSSDPVEASIAYLPLPGDVVAGQAYRIVGTQGENGWYTSDVTIRPGAASSLAGYQISTELDGVYAPQIALSADGGNQGPARVYLMNAQGQKTDALAVSETINIDREAPQSKISVGIDEWDSFLSTVTFGLYYPASQEARLSAEDSVSGPAGTWYWVSPDDYRSVEAVEGAASFTEGDRCSLLADSSNIVYGKMKDGAGNVRYVRSDGIVIDSTPPSVGIPGVGSAEDRHVFTAEGSKNVSVTDSYLDSVVLYTADTEAGLAAASGAAQAVSHGKSEFVLAETSVDTWYRVVAQDKAGNVTEKIIGLMAPIFDVSVADVSLEGQVYGYAQPASKPIVITNRGNAAISIESIAVDTDGFVVQKGDTLVQPGAQLTAWTVRAKEGLLPQSKAYAGKLTVSYKKVVGGAETTATVHAAVSIAVAPRKLTIADPALTRSKVYDGSTSAQVVAGQLQNVVGDDAIAVLAQAAYESETVGIGKRIAVSYAIEGPASDRYLAPADWTVDDGEIVRQTPVLEIACADVVYDGTRGPDPQIVRTTSNQVATFSYKEQGADDSLYTTEIPTKVGAYTVRARTAQTETMFEAEAFADFRIYYVAGGVDTSIEVGPGLPPIFVEGLENIFDPATENTDDASGYTKRDAQIVAQGGSVEVKLVIGAVSADSGNSLQEIESQAGRDGFDLGTMWDASLLKVVTLPNGQQLDPVAVTDLPRPVTMAIDLPADQRGKTAYRAYRFHKGAVDFLGADYNDLGERAIVDESGTMRMQTRGFSTYATAYAKPYAPLPEHADSQKSSFGMLVPAGDDLGDGVVSAGVLAVIGLAVVVSSAIGLLRRGRRLAARRRC